MKWWKRFDEGGLNHKVNIALIDLGGAAFLLASLLIIFVIGAFLF